MKKFFRRIFSIPDITVFGQKMIQKNGCLRQRQTGSYRAAEPAEDRGGNCIAFPDGMRLRKHLEQEFDIHKNRQIYWDDIPIFCYPEEYELEVYPMKSQDVREIDSVEELATIDESYRKYIM